MPHWMRIAAQFNPVDWGVRAAREVVLPGTAWGTVGLYLAPPGRPLGGDRRVRDLVLPCLPADA